MVPAAIRRIIMALVPVVALMTVPLWASRYIVLIVMLFGVYLSMAQMWNLLAGYSGLISLGQQIFIGLGGYTLAVLTIYFQWPAWLSILAGGLSSVFFAVMICIPIFRMSGIYFAIGTWIAAEALLIWFSNWGYTRKGMGLFIKAAYSFSINQLYYAAVLLGIASVALVYVLLKSRLGLALMAMRDDEDAAEGAGVDRFRAKLICFLIAAFVTGVAAGLLYLNQVFIQPFKAFSIEWTVRLCFIVIIGGIGTIEGPIIGTLIFVVLQQYFAEYTGISLILLGSVSIVTMMAMPKGIMGTIQEKLGFDFLSPRRT